MTIPAGVTPALAIASSARFPVLQAGIFEGVSCDGTQALGAVSILELPAPATREAIPTLRAFVGAAADGGLAIEQGAPTLGTGQSWRWRIGASRDQG